MARAWRADRHAPRWARRHSPAGWAPVLAAPAAHGWVARDVTALIADWAGAGGHWLPASPHKPIGLLGAMLAWHRTHNTLDDRPAAADMAREAEELAAGRARIAAAEVARNAATRRAHSVAAEVARVDAVIRAAREER